MSARHRRPRIGVIGSARIEPGDDRHDAGIRLGSALATAGYDVVTGGYGGLMGAVSQGAAEAGGHVVGLTMKAWTEIQANRWVAEEVGADDWFDRLRRLATCDAIVALEGGLGTLAELSTTWANGQTDPDTNPPVILVGPAWAELVGAIGRLLVVDARDLSLVRLVRSVDEVGPMLEIVLGSDDRTGRRFG